MIYVVVVIIKDYNKQKIPKTISFTELLLTKSLSSPSDNSLSSQTSPSELAETSVSMPNSEASSVLQDTRIKGNGSKFDVFLRSICLPFSMGWTRRRYIFGANGHKKIDIVREVGN